MLLNELFAQAEAIDIRMLADDSRIIMDHALFFCNKGIAHDSHDFVDEAIRNGAVAVVYSESLPHYQEGIFYIKVEDTHEAFNYALRKFYGNPAEKLFMIAVTGTNGKSTIAMTLKNIGNQFFPTGYIGTIGVEYDSVVEEETLTTPQPILLSSTLADMLRHNITSVAMEASSQGLVQGRLDALTFDQAIFTNLTHDHLDQHKTMEAYFEAKKHLFDLLKESGVAIICIDDPYGMKLSELLIQKHVRVVTTGIDHPEANYYASDIKCSLSGSSFVLHVEGQDTACETSLIGRFEVQNLLSVIASLHLRGIPMDQILSQVRHIPEVKGRFNLLKSTLPFHVMVDYAHTPDGFEKIFSTARTIMGEKGRIIAVYGSAGKRDKLKRPIMGEISDKWCSLIILTQEDNRNEEVRTIAEDIARGIHEHPYRIIENRYEAIREAIETACSGDMVMILGLGDERNIDTQYGLQPWMGDIAAAREVMNNLQQEDLKDEHE